MTAATETIRVLHVDDEPDFAEVTAAFLKREDDRISVTTATSAADGLDVLTDRDVDCIVSDYDMPGRTGIEFLDAVREDHPDIPFMLFTGKGSEEVASDAISAGVTDYIQKRVGTEQYELLATRIDTAVGQYRAERELERQNDLFEKAQEIADVGAWEYDTVTETSYVTAETRRIHGLPLDEPLPPERSFEHYHPKDRSAVEEAFGRAVRAGESYDVEARLVTDDGDQCWVQTRGEPQTDDGDIVRVRGTLQDITERKRRERELERQNERLEDLARVLSHVVRTPLERAGRELTRAERTRDGDAFQRVRRAHDRIETLVEDISTLARQGREVTETEFVSLDGVARSAWTDLDTTDLTLKTVGDCRVAADPDRLCRLFESLLDNAVRHAGTDVTVAVGPIDPLQSATRDVGKTPIGFYVEDDGVGIDESERDIVFDAGYSTTVDGTGFGLRIVRQVVDSHDWEIRLTESADGGARFEITGVDVADE